MSSRQARAREFPPSVRAKIKKRDNGECIFCRMDYRMDREEWWFEMQIKQYMHYIPRAHGGLGIEQNGAVGCQYHHHMMDNGNQGNREEMLAMFRDYLKGIYPEWEEGKLVYDKYGGGKGRN